MNFHLVRWIQLLLNRAQLNKIIIMFAMESRMKILSQSKNQRKEMPASVDLLVLAQVR